MPSVPASKMETTDFEDILNEVADSVTALDPLTLDAAEFASIRRAAKRRLEVAWEYHYWPDLDRTEQRFFRLAWNSGTAYTATNEVYYGPTGKYYQSLQASTNQAPADAAGNTNLSYWEVSSRSYSANTYSASGSYVQGNRVSYSDGIYQLYVAGPVTGVLPTDTTKWGLLTAFDQYVAYEQSGKTAFTVVNSAWDGNPRTSTRVCELNWALSENGVQIADGIAFAWLDYRIRCPKLSGDAYDSTVTYTSGQQVYFSSAATPGNFYTALTTTTGNSPDAAPSSWAVVQIPRIFHKFLVHSVTADWLRGPGGASPEDVAEELAVAMDALDNMKSLLVGQQSQRIKTVVRTR